MMRSRICLPLTALLAVSACGGSYSGADDPELDADVLALVQTDSVSQPSDQEEVDGRVALDAGFNEALRSAVLSSRSLESAVREFREAAAGIDVASSARRPQITGSATAGGIAEGSRDDVRTNLGASLDTSLRQLIYDGGETSANIDAASARAYAARAGISARGNEVGQAAATAWIDLWQHSTHLALLQERLREVRPLLDRIERLIAGGMVDRAALAGAERQILDIELEEERLQASRDDARNRFERYFGEAPNTVSAPPSLFARADLENMRELWPEAPELVASAAELVAAQRDVDAAAAQRRPRISLSTGVNAPLSDQDDAQVTTGLFLEHTFGDGGRRRAEIEAREERLAARQSDFDDARDEARSDFESALSQYSSLVSSLAVLEEQIEVLDVERETLRSQLASGQSSVRDLVESEILYYRALARQIELRAQRSRIEVMLGSRTGALLPRLGIEPESLL